MSWSGLQPISVNSRKIWRSSELKGGTPVDVQRRRRQLSRGSTPRNSRGGVSRGPDDCTHYPDCSHLERLFADPPVGPTSVSLPGDAEPICRGCDHFEPRHKR